MTISTAPITAEQAIDAIAAAAGDQLVAAERLKISREQLAGIIASDPLAFRRLQDQMRVLTLLDTQETLSIVNVAIRGALSSLEGKDLVSLAGRLTEAMAKLTDDKTTTINNNNSLDVILRALPSDVRESFLALVQPSADDDDSVDAVFSSEFAPRIAANEAPATIDAHFSESAAPE